MGTVRGRPAKFVSSPFERELKIRRFEKEFRRSTKRTKPVQKMNDRKIGAIVLGKRSPDELIP